MQDDSGKGWFVEMLDQVGADPELLRPKLAEPKPPQAVVGLPEDEWDHLRRVLDQVVGRGPFPPGTPRS